MCHDWMLKCYVAALLLLLYKLFGFYDCANWLSSLTAHSIDKHVPWALQCHCQSSANFSCGVRMMIGEFGCIQVCYFQSYLSYMS